MRIKTTSGSKNLQETLYSWAKTKTNEPFIIQTDTGKEISFGSFFSAVCEVKAFLGKRPKTVVAAISGGVIDAVFWIATLTGGHTFVPVSPQITEFEFDELVRMHNPDLVIIDREIRDKNIKVITSEAAEKMILKATSKTHLFEKIAHAKEGAVYLSSSGSTGTPKGMMLSATKVAITADNIRKSHDLNENDRGLTPLPFYHVNAPIVSLMTSLLAGSTLIIAPKFSRTHFWNWVETYDPTWISIVPTIVAILLTTQRPAFLNNASLRFIRTASAPLPVAYFEKFEKKFRVPVIETYGISEAASTITANPVPPKVHKGGSVGLPIGVSLIISDQNHKKGIREVSSGTVGEICIQGDNVINAYENGAGKDAFIDGWFRTGDLGYKDSDGYVYITGRIKDIIIHGGENIAPREIEEVLLTHKKVSEAVVVGQPDPIYGEKIVAFVVLQQGVQKSKTISLDLKKYISEKLSSYKVPQKIQVLPELPKGRTGKIDKTVLKKPPYTN